MVEQPVHGPTSSPRIGTLQRAVASFEHYQDAERAVETLASEGFPVDRITIVGCGLRVVEKVTGRVSAVDVAVRSAVSGALIGALFGWLLGVFDLADPLVAAVWLAVNGALLGAVLGAVFGLLAYALTRGRRGFTTVGGVQAQRYELHVDAETADRAAYLLRARQQSVPGETSGETDPKPDRPHG